MAAYTLIAHSNSVTRADGATVPDDPQNIDWQAYQGWLAAGNTPAAAPAPPVAIPSCQLWQLQAVLTAAQWSAAMNAIAAMNNPIISAFAAHGSNVIPANSTTLAALAVDVGIDPATLPALISQASTIAIP